MAKRCKHSPMAESIKEILKSDEVVLQCQEHQEVVMRRARIGSSNIFSAGIHGDDLYVEFISGYPDNVKTSLYRYPNKSLHLNALLKADSAGEYFADEIKAEVGNDYEKIR